MSIKLGSQHICNVKLGATQIEELRVGTKLIWKYPDSQWGYGYHSVWKPVYPSDDTSQVRDEKDWWELEIINLPSTPKVLYIFMGFLYGSEYSVGNADSRHVNALDYRTYRPVEIEITDCKGNVLLSRQEWEAIDEIPHINYDPNVNGDSLHFKFWKISSTNLPSGTDYVYFAILPENTTGMWYDRYFMQHTNSMSGLQKTRIKGILCDLDSDIDRGIFFVSNNPSDPFDYENGSHFILMAFQANKDFYVIKQPFDFTQSITIRRYDIYNGNVFDGLFQEGILYNLPETDGDGHNWQLLRIAPNDTSKSMKFFVGFDFKPRYDESLNGNYSEDFPQQIEYPSLVKNIRSYKDETGFRPLEQYYQHKILGFTGGNLVIVRISQIKVPFNVGASSSTYKFASTNTIWYYLNKFDNSGNFLEGIGKIRFLSNYAQLSLATLNSGENLVIRRGKVLVDDDMPTGATNLYETLIVGHNGAYNDYNRWKLSDDGFTSNESGWLNLHKHIDVSDNGDYWFKYSSSNTTFPFNAFLPLYSNYGSLTFTWSDDGNVSGYDVILRDSNGNFYQQLNNGDTISINSSLLYCYVQIKFDSGTTVSSTPFEITLKITRSS